MSRERLRRVAALGVRLANERRIRFVAHLLLVAGLVFVALRLRSVWHDSHIELAHIGWGWLAGSLALAVSAVLASGFIWLEILRLLGATPRPSWAAVYFQGQLGKYIPGSLWQYASRGALANTRGIPLRPVATSFPIELAAIVYAAAAFSLLLVGWWGAVGVICLLAAAPAVTTLVRARVGVRAAGKAALLYAATWLLIGISFWMAARGLVRIPFANLPVYAGAFAAAWIVGLIAIYAPGGIGVREALLVAILGPRIGTADAVLVAAASRVVFALADLIAAGLSIVSLGRSGPTAGRRWARLEVRRAAAQAQAADDAALRKPLH